MALKAIGYKGVRFYFVQNEFERWPDDCLIPAVLDRPKYNGEDMTRLYRVYERAQAAADELNKTFAQYSVDEVWIPKERAAEVGDYFDVPCDWMESHRFVSMDHWYDENDPVRFQRRRYFPGGPDS